MGRNRRPIAVAATRSGSPLSGTRAKRASQARDVGGLDESVRQRIEATALEMFSEQELHRVNLAEFAARAKTSLQTVYRYYGGKEGILLAMIDRELAGLVLRVAEDLAAAEGCKERLRVVYSAVLRHFQSRPKVAALLQRSGYGHALTQDASPSTPSLSALLVQVIGEGRDAGVLTDEVELRVLLDFFWGVLWRLLPLCPGERRISSLDAHASFELLWRALAKPPRRPAPSFA